MTSIEVLDIVLREIDGNWSISNAHGVDLKRCLLPKPVMSLFQDMSGRNPDPSRTINLWLVLEEDPDTRSGYKIVYDEQKNMFGLAIKDQVENIPIYLGVYGSFLNTLEGM